MEITETTLDKQPTISKTMLWLIVLAFAGVVGWFLYGAITAFGSAPSGLPATIATSSTVLVGTSTPMTLFATSTGCTSRIITTGAQAIKISFSWHLSSTSLDKNIGHFQGGSTTVAYDSGIYGCSVVTARGIYEGGDILGSESSSTVTVSEGR